jgi:predicted Zn-dependent protease
MKRSSSTTATLAVLSLATALALAPQAAAQSRTTGGVRGKVVDEAGKPIEGVRLDLEFKGETRRPIAYFVMSDKKGGFIRTGLAGGNWKLTFSKQGYTPYGLETALYSGGFSDLPDVVLKAAAAAAPTAPAANEVVPEMPKDAGTMKDVYNQAVEATRAGKLDEAEAHYKQILEHLPDMAEIHYNLGRLYILKKDMEAAEAAFRKAAELQPARAPFVIALSELLAVGGKTSEAAQLLVDAAPRFEQEALFQFALGTACLNAGKNKEATEALQKALALDPTRAEIHYHLGTLAVQENKVADAVAQLNKYIAASGQNEHYLATAKRLVDALSKPKK